MIIVICSALLVSATLTSGNIVSTTTKDGQFELLILHNNDMHARFEQTSQLSAECKDIDRNMGKCYGGFARVATVVKEARRAAASGEGPPVLYLNAGDTYTGTAWFTIYKWKIAAEFINALQPDAICLGNHEFDETIEDIAHFISNVTTPVLAANLILDKVPQLQNEANLQKSVIIYMNGTKIGIIGYLTPTTKFIAPKNDVEYEDEIVSIQREVNKLKDEGVNILIALGHSGYLKDIEIAKNVDGLDLVVGGHSNTFLLNSNTTDEKPEVPEGPYPKMIKQASGRIVPVVQAYAYTKYMGKLQIQFDSNGEILKCNGTPILLNKYVPQDVDIVDIINKYKENIHIISHEVVGSSLVFLDGDCRLKECNIGNLISDAVLEYQTKTNGNSDAYVVIIQGGRIRTSIYRSEKLFNLTKGDWLMVIPYTDALSIITMNGTEMFRALEHSVSTWRTIDSTGQFLQMANMNVTYDLAKPPGSRVVKAFAKCTTCNELAEVREHYEYKVIMPSFLAEGGDGFTFNDLPKEMLTYSDLECVYDYLSKHSPVKHRVSGRITILNKEKVSYANSGLRIVGSITLFCFTYMFYFMIY